MSGRIVFINQATGYLTIDIINEFAKEFDEVALITGSIRIQNTQLNHKVKISYIARYNRGNNLKKAASWVLGTAQIFILLIFKYRYFEKFFFTIPPTAYLLASNFRSAYSIAVYDLYPEALLIHNFSEQGFIYKWWSNRNRSAFHNAHVIYTLSDYMKTKILEYSTGANVRVISNWSAFSGYTRIEKAQNMLIRREHLEGKFIIQYSGNIGATHNVETIIEVAELLRLHQDIEFLIIGRGERMKTIGDLIQRKGLKNCMLLPYRKDEELFESLCVADLAIITLDDKTPDISVPSKVYNIMAAGVPVMAITSLSSEISGIILRHGIGKVFEKNNITGMCEFVHELRSDPDLRENFSANSLKAAKSFTNANAIEYLKFYNE